MAYTVLIREAVHVSNSRLEIREEKAEWYFPFVFIRAEYMRQKETETERDHISETTRV